MTRPSKIKIMLAEDHNSARQAYASVIAAEKNMEVIGQAGNGFDLLKLIEKRQPDIVITDIEMPVMNGYRLLEALQKNYPNVKPIVFSMHNEDQYISQLIMKGACAYLPKSCDIDDLLLAINRVYTDGFYFNPTVSKIVIAQSLKEKQANATFEQLDLTLREIEVLKLVCEEKTNAQIADRLNVSRATVDFHRQSIYRKTQSASVIGLVKYAIKNGIASLD